MTSRANATDRATHYAGPHAITSFRDIDDVEELGALPEAHRLRLGVAMRSRPAAPLYDAANLPPRVTQDHSTRTVLPGPQFLAITGHELGSFGLLRSGGQVFINDDVQPVSMNEMIGPGGMPSHWMRGLFAPDAEIVESNGPVGVALHPHMVWGHFLQENLIRVHLLAQLRSLGHPVPIAVPIDSPTWVREFVGLYFSANEMILYNSVSQRVAAPAFILPGLMMEYSNFHPMLNLVVQELLDRVLGTSPLPLDRPRRLYLSRARNNGFNAIANEAEVESTLVDLGFTVLPPQEISLRAQLALYAGAECIVAPFSSALHNALFAPMGTPVMCFGWMNRCQSGIAALRGQPLAYLKPRHGNLIFPPDDRPPGVFRMQIDCLELARQVPEFLRFAAMPRSSTRIEKTGPT